MTTLTEDVKTLLDTLGAAGGVHNMINEDAPLVYPFVVFQRVASDANVSLSGPSALQNTRLQIDLYGRTVAQVSALELALETAMAAWAVQNVPLISQDFYDEQAGAYRISKDFSVWSTN